MSLINDALRDLELRRMDSEHDNEPRLGSVPTNNDRYQGPRFKVMGFLCVLPMVFLGGYWLAGEHESNAMLSIDALDANTHIDTHVFPREPIQEDANKHAQERIQRVGPAQKTPMLTEHNMAKSKRIAPEVVSVKSDKSKPTDHVSPTDHANPMHVSAINDTGVSNDAVVDKGNKGNKGNKVDKVNVLLSHLLTMGEQALGEYRLTTPVGHNALFYFNQVLSIDAQNKRASSGIKRINTQYLELIKAAYKKQSRHPQENTVDIHMLEQRLLGLLSDDDRVHYISKMDEFKVSYSEQTVESDIYALASSNSLAEHKLRKTKPIKTIPIKTTPAGKIAIADTSPVSITLSHIQYQKNVIEAYQDLKRQEFYDEAGAFLLGEISKFPYQKTADMLVQALFDHYVEQGQMSRVKSLLDTQYAKGEEWYYYQALYIQSVESEQDALTYLESVSLQGEPEIAMYAALLSRQKQYARSSTEYKRLISMDNHNATYWLGLAISEDALGHTQEALRGFKYAMRKGAHADSVLHYIQERISVLSGVRKQDLELTQW